MSPTGRVGVIVMFEADGRTHIYPILETGEGGDARDLARRLQAFARDLIENPSAAAELAA